MAIQDILVHLSSSKSNAKRLDFAIGLAQAHGARLTGVYVLSYPDIPQYIRVHLGSDVLENQKLEATKQAEAVGATFREACKKEGLSFGWHKEEGRPSEVLIRHARHMDLVVIGQRDPSDEGTVGANSLPDRVILSAGRPVLVVPHIGPPSTFGSRVMVAWDASRLAARAINDAIPLMKEAKKVTVLAINPESDGAKHGDVPGADICAHLARHGITAEASHIQSDDVDAGDMLLSRASDSGCDMIVMGAYGHARLREVVLGGVTRHMLRHMTMPVLMSH